MSKKTLRFQEVKSLGPVSTAVSQRGVSRARGPRAPTATGAPAGWSEGRHTQCLFTRTWEVGAACLPLPLPRGPRILFPGESSFQVRTLKVNREEMCFFSLEALRTFTLSFPDSTTALRKDPENLLPLQPS